MIPANIHPKISKNIIISSCIDCPCYNDNGGDTCNWLEDNVPFPTSDPNYKFPYEKCPINIAGGNVVLHIK